MHAPRSGLLICASLLVILACGSDPGGARSLADGKACGGDDQCLSGRCDQRVCITPKAIGVACTGGGECASRACECFDAACTDLRCRSSWCGKCEIAASDTSCGSGLGDPEPVADPAPDDACGGVAVACLRGACRKLNGQGCSAAAECVSGLCTRSTCLEPDGQACASNVACGSGVCRASVCSSAAALNGACDVADGAGDCQAGLTCALGVCKKVDAQTCGANAECVSGVCRSGVCGAASALNGPCDDADGTADCQAGLTCSQALCRSRCSANSECGSDVCRGGACGPASAVTGPCDAADGTADCQAGLVCSEGSCRYPFAHACTLDLQCEGGSCAQGVCCHGACDGLCAACNVSGAAGTCTSLPSGTDCNTDGTGCRDLCDGAGVCVLQPHC